VGGVWYVKMQWGVGGWCMVCIGKGVKIGIVVICGRENGQCEL
jgi:hypothetical protein